MVRKVSGQFIPMPSVCVPVSICCCHRFPPVYRDNVPQGLNNCVHVVTFKTLNNLGQVQIACVVHKIHEFGETWSLIPRAYASVSHGDLNSLLFHYQYSWLPSKAYQLINNYTSLCLYMFISIY